MKLHSINRRHVLATTMAAAALPSLAVADERTALDPALDAVFERIKPVALAGALVKPGGIQWSGVRGLRRDGLADPATLQDRWHLGSNTKAMTAAVFARLVDQDRVRWDLPLGEAFPGITINKGWDDATVDHFMTHTAGLNDDTVMGMDWLMNARDDPASLAEQRRAIVRKVLSAPPPGTPGAFQYGNGNYVLVGAAIEAITGGSWEQAIQTELFEPLGLASAGFGPPSGENAWGHHRAGEQVTAMDPAKASSDNPLALGPAGTVHMTVADYARFLQVFMKQGDGWLRPETLDRLITPASGRTYAYGWIVLEQPWARGPVIAHEGSNTLWHAISLVDPIGGTAVMGLSNDGERGGPACQRLATGILGTL